ncbi:hypothetical protein ABK040_010327 [Willaertia magna]
MVSKQDVLSLYRKILKQGMTTIKYSNKDYFKKRIREEFEVASKIVNKKERAVLQDKMYKKGLEFLEKNIGGIV